MSESRKSVKYDVPVQNKLPSYFPRLIWRGGGRQSQADSRCRLVRSRWTVVTSFFSFFHILVASFNSFLLLIQRLHDMDHYTKSALLDGHSFSEWTSRDAIQASASQSVHSRRRLFSFLRTPSNRCAASPHRRIKRPAATPICNW